MRGRARGRVYITYRPSFVMTPKGSFHDMLGNDIRWLCERKNYDKMKEEHEEGSP